MNRVSSSRARTDCSARTAALILFALATAALAQPTLERNACLHPLELPYSGVTLALAAADWDGDGRDDLGYGTAYEIPSGSDSAEDGAFRTFELDAGGESWTLEDSLAGGAGHRLGWAIAAGDFDGDLLPESAVGSPHAGGGEVVVREPCCGGSGAQLGITLRQGAPGVSGSSEDGDRFGLALAAGNFDGDDYDDLAVGVPYETWSDATGVLHGAVQIFYGSDSGLDGTRDLLFGQHAFSGQTREQGDLFGFALAAGDLDGDGYDDLAIGAPLENEGAVVDSGIVHVVFGSATGLDFARQQDWTQSSSGIASSPEDGDEFGRRLAIADFDRATISPIRGDLAISVPCESDGAIACAGAVHVLYGGGGGPTATGSTFLLRPGGSVAGTEFGDALLAADLDADKAADLVVAAIGHLDDEPPGFDASGEAHLFYGKLSGEVRSSGLAPWRPLAGECFEAGVEAFGFGRALAAGDFDDDGHTDLAIGIPGWTDSSLETHKGTAEILFGSNALFRDGFETADSGRWSSSAP